jgi:archaellum component FlaC
MTNQQKKHYLGQYIKIKDEHRRQLDRHRELRESFDNVKAQVLNDMPKGSIITFDKTGESLARIDELEAQNKALYKEYMEIEKSINSLNDTVLRQLMRLRYMDNLTFEAISCELHFSFRHTLRLHGKALTNVVILRH